MTTIAELKALAESATDEDVVLLKKETILALIALVEMQHEALDTCARYKHGGTEYQFYNEGQIEDAIVTYENFGKEST